MFKKESIVDPDVGKLDPHIFEFSANKNPIIKKSIKRQIMDGIRIINKSFPVQNIYIIGSLLTTKYTDESDIDVTVEVNTGDEESYKQLTSDLNGHRILGTKHPINYHILNTRLNPDNTDNIYDLVDDRWLKISKPKNANIKPIMDKFANDIKRVDIKINKLKRSLLDVETLKKLHFYELDELKTALNKKINLINWLIYDLIGIYKHLKMDRKLAFKKSFTPDQIRELGSKNNLPQNILYKLYEKYQYVQLFKELKQLVEKRPIKIQDLLKIL